RRLRRQRRHLHRPRRRRRTRRAGALHLDTPRSRRRALGAGVLARRSRVGNQLGDELHPRHGSTDMTLDTDSLVTRYIAVWNEPDAQRRRERVAELWGDSGQSLPRVLDPRGIDAISARVAASHDKWVAGRGFEFRLSGTPQAHHDAVRCNWAMGPRGGGDVVSLGLSFLLLDAHGLLHSDLQF